jgi:hypothetical protein
LIDDGRTGLLCEPTPEAIKNAVIDATHLKDLEKILQTGLSEALLRHSSLKIVNEHIQFYTSVLNRDH